MVGTSAGVYHRAVRCGPACNHEVTFLAILWRESRFVEVEESVYRALKTTRDTCIIKDFNRVAWERGIATQRHGIGRQPGSKHEASQVEWRVGPKRWLTGNGLEYQAAEPEADGAELV